MTDYKALYEQQLEENKKLNEYLKTAEENLDEEMLKNEKLLKRLTHNTKLIRKIKKELDSYDKSVCKEEEEEVKEKILKDICIHCDRKKKGPGDMFIVHKDLNCHEEEWCGECYMKVERYKLRSYP